MLCLWWSLQAFGPWLELSGNKGRWRMTWPSSGVWNHSQVTCVFVHPLHLKVLEDGAESTRWCSRPAKGHLAGPGAAFHLFLEARLQINDFCSDRKPVYDHSVLLLGDRHVVYYSESGEYFMGIFSASDGAKTFHAIIDNFSTVSQGTTPAWISLSFSLLDLCVDIAK